MEERSDLVALFRALGDPTRVRIFDYLCAVAEEETRDCPGGSVLHRGATVGDVCSHVLGVKTSSAMSFHLKEMKMAGLIHSNRSGRQILCTVAPEAVEVLRDYLAHLPDVEEDSLEVMPEKESEPALV